ncbi:MAG TPA: VCBS repeat-containing protein [Opitutaceae bacterium]
MKRYPTRRLLTALLALLFAPAAFAAAQPAKAPAPKAKKQPSGLKFRVQQLHVDNNEGCAIADFDRDGNLDISAGEFWYAGPAFSQKRAVRKLEPFQKDYLTNNGEHAVDVDGDGWVDIVSGAFMDTAVAWYRNPGAEGLKSGALWERKVLFDTKLAQNEITLLHDLDGDGKPEFVVNSWGLTNAMMAYSFAKDAQGQPTLKPWTIQAGGPAVNGHGIGFGDLSGDGKDDILFGLGWYERPATGADTQPWKRRPDWRFPHASTPMLVVDLNGDGRNDIIWGHGHNYGLYWEERRDDNKDGSTNWRHHTIDDKFSQAHALVWTDLDGDGQPELVTGRRHKAHSGNDPGDAEPGCLYYFKWNKQTQQFAKFVIAEGGPGTGLQLRVVDMNKDGRPDIVAAGKASTHIVWNEGPK